MLFMHQLMKNSGAFLTHPLAFPKSFLPVLCPVSVADGLGCLCARCTGCKTILVQVLIPFLGTVPFVLLMGVAGPYGYMAHNTFGIGMRITEIQRNRDEIEDLWKEFDLDGSGDLDQEELRNLIESTGLSTTSKLDIADKTKAVVRTATVGIVGGNKYKRLFKKLDKDQSGTVDKEEFMQWWASRSRSERKAALEDDESDNPIFDGEDGDKPPRKSKK